MIAEKFSELEQFKEISQKMLALAQVNNWEELPVLEIQRKSIIESFFSENTSEQDVPQVEKMIQDVLLINSKITGLAEKNKISIGLQRQNIKKRQNVHSAYLQNK